MGWNKFQFAASLRWCAGHATRARKGGTTGARQRAKGRQINGYKYLYSCQYLIFRLQTAEFSSFCRVLYPVCCAVHVSLHENVLTYSILLIELCAMHNEYFFGRCVCVWSGGTTLSIFARNSVYLSASISNSLCQNAWLKCLSSIISTDCRYQTVRHAIAPISRRAPFSGMAINFFSPPRKHDFVWCFPA